MSKSWSMRVNRHFFWTVMTNSIIFRLSLYFAESGTLEWNDSASNISDGDFKGRLSLTAVLCEWICTFLIVLFSISLVPEFRVIEIYRPVVLVKAYQKSLKARTPSTQQENGPADELEDRVSESRNNAHNQPNDTSSEPLMQLP